MRDPGGAVGLVLDGEAPATEALVGELHGVLPIVEVADEPRESEGVQQKGIDCKYYTVFVSFAVVHQNGMRQLRCP